MAKLVEHHIQYDPEWTVEINQLMHKILTVTQRTKASPMHYARLTNFVHAIGSEWNRMRAELDTGQDLRVKDYTKKGVGNA